MRDLVLLVKNVPFINVSVGRQKRRKSVVIDISSVKLHAIKCLGVENICAVKDATLVNVGNAHCKVGGLVLVGRKCMKGCLVMCWHRYVAQLVRNCWPVVSISAQRDATVVHVLRLVELLSLNHVDVEAFEKRFLAIKIWRVKGSVIKCVTVGAMRAGAAVVMGIVLHVQRFVRKG
ncbi:unnamed protein product [Rhodiola kirilowii]